MDQSRMVVTAKLSDEAALQLTRLRDRFFPQERNYLQAHVTLFHSAPIELAQMWQVFEAPINIQFTEPYFLGKGFAIKAQCPELLQWRRECLSAPLDFTPQDLALRHLHVTLQNKVDPSQARLDLETFSREWQPFESEVLGFDTWIYENGPWRFLRSYPFIKVA